jgi:hypothetical protein
MDTRQEAGGSVLMNAPERHCECEKSAPCCVPCTRSPDGADGLCSPCREFNRPPAQAHCHLMELIAELNIDLALYDPEIQSG